MICFSNPKANMQQAPQGTLNLILEDGLLRLLLNLKPSWITTVMAFRDAKFAQFIKVMEFMSGAEPWKKVTGGVHIA